MAVTDLLPTFVIRIRRERIDTFCLEPHVAPWAQMVKYSVDMTKDGECLKSRYSMLAHYYSCERSIVVQREIGP